MRPFKLYVPFNPFGYRGVALWFLIVINKRFKDDKGLLAHEYCHIRQQRDYGFFTYMYRYWRDLEFRAEMEYRAFKYGSGYPPERIHALLTLRYGIPSKIAEEVIGR